ncbi:site-specific integrase [Devosia rhizoryzae]|uniref:Site-specific integrase n=1 Tax=Devosia rhizoryzae TaxID=2774137 RepID=A0ABX7C3P1_9HYPH|nr:site-specific integrase [Devosia rhizoryzae]QQR38413.1 site-specific integrase [Devosia rhizoryzae]
MASSSVSTDRAFAPVSSKEFLPPVDLGDVLITDLLEICNSERADKVMAGERIRFALVPLVKFWAGRTAAAVTRQSCEAYGKWRSRADGTVRRELGVLRASINHAHAEGRLSRKLVIHLPARPEPKERWLSKNEAARLLIAARQAPRARSYLPLFILIGLHTGARKSSITALRWDQIDLVAGLIDWQPQGRKRTKKRRPRIRIPRKLLGHLRRARLRAPSATYVIHENGSPIFDPKKSFAAACDLAGLSDVSPHVLRHTRATWGMQAGAKTWELSGFLGMTEQTLVEIYGHHHPDFQREAAELY